MQDAIKKSTKYKGGKPLSQFEMVYDAQSAQLEPIYYWMLDFIQGLGFDTKKVTDNFMSSPGSGHFAEMGQKATRMQEEGMKLYGYLNQTVKNVMNLIYDLKEFEIRLEHYEKAKSEDPKEKEAGMLALKQIWLDNVDIKRGRGSIHQMASMEMGFSTVREIFMMSNSLEDIEKNEVVNEQVKRVVKPRLVEFLDWRERSEKELRSRFNIEKSYLRTQVNTIKLQASWIRPYLKAAEQLRQKGFEGDAALVNAFSTSRFELTLFATQKGKPPSGISNYNFKRNYNSVLVVSLKYRGHLSQRATQKGDMAFGMGGRIEMNFESYVLNDQELDLFWKNMEKNDVGEVLGLTNSAEESLKQLETEIQHFLEDEKEKADKKKAEEDKKNKKAKGNTDNVNPFAALFSGIGDLFGGGKKKEKKSEEVEEVDEIKKDNWYEKQYREEVKDTAKARLYLVYDIYKKSHGMESSPQEFEN